MNLQLERKICKLISEHNILVFMKGHKLMPMCGFSNTVIQILNRFSIDYHTINVLEDEEIRQGIKIYSKWPTIPQIYINGEFIGGSDILLDLYGTSKLQEILEKAINS
uniref:glutaredoxin n=1 Tax=Ahnfeltia fastigiata TaxID=31363 RepID=UPI001D12B892|nr:glutaredoxin [Ahnfeltia fastigiata]UAT97659.1 glutaredoxin [Ahnfeltia fastigiata]UAT97863.1 glutaredoxin [Ahnfeltia fastigiata]